MLAETPSIPCEGTRLLSRRDRQLPEWTTGREANGDEETASIGLVVLRHSYIGIRRRAGTKATTKSLLAFSVVLAILASLGVLLLARGRTASNLERWSSADSSQSSRISHNRATVDAKLAIWDDWKENAHAVGGWLQSETSGFNASVLREQAQEYGSQVTNDALPKTQENAEKFGKQVQSWWSSAEDESRSVGSAVEDKQRILETNFQTWWASASLSEKSWWNATVHAMAQDLHSVENWANEEEHDVGERFNTSIHEIADVSTTAGREIAKDGNAVGREIDESAKAAGHSIGQETSVAGNAAKGIWDKTTTATGQTLGNWFNDSERAIVKAADMAGSEIGKDTEAAGRTIEQEAAAVGNASEGLWERTSNAVASDESTIASKIGEWWKTATGTLKTDEDTVSEKTGEWWHEVSTSVEDDSQKALNATKNAAKNDKDFVISKTKQAWNLTKQNVQNDEMRVAEKSKETWEAVDSEARKDEHAIGSTFVSWWNAVVGGGSSAWNGTLTKEDEWWNATEDWFKDHLRKHVEDSSTLPLLYLNSTDSYPLLMNGFEWYDFSADFFLIVSGLDTQINQAYCAVATAAAVLNSFRGDVDLPVDPIYDPHPYATQEFILESACVYDNVIHVDRGGQTNSSFNGLVHPPGGLSLDQTDKLIACHLPQNWNVTTVHVDPDIVSVEDIRRDMISALRNPSQRVLVNYDRSVLGQEGTGHFSPLGSYSTKIDSFLILDVAKYKYPPVWYVCLCRSLLTHDAYIVTIPD